MPKSRIKEKVGKELIIVSETSGTIKSVLKFELLD